MSKSYFWLEETNQRINDFSIGYMMNPNFNRKKGSKDQVKTFFKTTFGPDTNTHINKILSKKYKSTSIGFYYMRVGGGYKGNVQSVELCNIYYY